MLDSLLKPESIVVVGASRRPGTIGHQVMDNLLRHGFIGPVYPVNPHATAVHSVRAYHSLSELPEVPELAVVVVPKEHVLDVVQGCADIGVRGIVVISAGFKEVGGAGREREAELQRIVRRHGMRMVGPNCMGLINTAPSTSMNATFAPTMPPRGPVAFMSQSGAMGVTILDYAAQFGIGISQFVSVGNKADVSGNDLLEYWSRDDDVGVILMYLEGFGNPRRFTRLARQVTRRKPVIAVKAGRTRAGARAASSHTGALGGVDIATDALFSQCGVLRVDTIEELFDAAIAFGNAPLPSGPGVAIVTNAGGPGILIADACEGAGLQVRPLSAAAQKALRAGLPEEASVANPVDMIASATADDYRRALRISLDDPAVDAAIAAYVPVGIGAPEVARAIREVAEGTDKPVLAVLMGRKGHPQGMAELRGAQVAAYSFPESAARALGAMYRYRRWIERPAGDATVFDVDDARVSTILATAMREGREWLRMSESFELLTAYGIPVAPYEVVATPEEALAAAERLGYPVVLKAIGADIVHKTEHGAVKLGLDSPAAVLHAVAELRALAPTDGEAAAASFLVQPSVTGGRETIIGMTMEPNFGSLIMFGLGGVYVEALRDVAFRVTPVTLQDAAEMIASLRGFPLLRGVRGEPGVDLEQLAEVIGRASQLAERHEEIRELDINPFLAFSDAGQSVAVDARVHVGKVRKTEGA